ncbi:acyl-CoA binding protein [Ascobolus immersus RN42]|uniref:Acyl-CoA binding protein n=1 Tax=Ascobolus immersus RN42 TaxID=1160509 RepID=A0A3N4ISZ9_ASCIM|nr:acyl-CoA binding protein [Ascobolus immersus RN42]
MYSPPDNFNEPEFVKHNKIAENLHEKFSEDERLKLYGLYKQSILGDNRVGRVEDAGKELGGYKPRERWQKWEDLKGKNKDEARREYVEFVKELEKKYKS